MSGKPPSNIEAVWGDFLTRKAAMLSVRDTLIRAYLPWAFHLADGAHARLPQRVSRDQVRSEAVTGLLHAVDHFEGRVKFETFARLRVLGAISDWVRRELRWETFSLDDLAASFDSEE